MHNKNISKRNYRQQKNASIKINNDPTVIKVTTPKLIIKVVSANQDISTPDQIRLLQDRNKCT